MLAAREPTWWDFWPSSATRLWPLLQVSTNDYTVQSLGAVVTHHEKYTFVYALALKGGGRKESCRVSATIGATFVEAQHAVDKATTERASKEASGRLNILSFHRSKTPHLSHQIWYLRPGRCKESLMHRPIRFGHLFHHDRLSGMEYAAAINSEQRGLGVSATLSKHFV